MLEVEPDRPVVPAPTSYCYLWPCNLPVFLAWQRLQSQWRLDVEGHKCGLDYAGVSSYLRDVQMLEGAALARMFDHLQVMEFESLNVWNEARP